MSTVVRRRRYWFWSGAVLAVAAIAVVMVYFWNSFLPPQVYDSPEKAFDGKSEFLQQTVIVPTLDTPTMKGKSVIWCSSFQMAWNHLKTDLARGPVQLRNAEGIAERLNRAKQSEADLVPSEFYATAGWVKDGIIEKIQAEMAKKFPKVSPPQWEPDSLREAVAYAYLQTAVRFKYLFLDNDESFLFTDSTGKQTAVKSFGIRKKDQAIFRELRGQVAILYFNEDSLRRDREVEEFIIDPFRDSTPHQIILARVKQKPTLGAMVADVESKTNGKLPRPWSPHFSETDTLLIPNIHWRIEHEYPALQGPGKEFLNPALAGNFLNKACQTIDFKLDRGGAELKSEARMELTKGGTGSFSLDRPFLLYLKKRDAKYPFFVMWVDNSELLCK
jgi:hypothetical protein